MLPRMGRVVFWPTMPGLGDPDWPNQCGSGGGWTTLLDDEAVVAHQQRFPWTPWIAFEPNEYDELFAGLDTAQTREAIERRLQSWSPAVATHTSARLHDLVVAAARTTAALHATTDPDKRAATRAHFVALLELLDVIAGPALEMLTPSELAVVVLEGRAGLVHELKSLEASDRWPGEAEADLDPLAEAAVRLGATAFAEGGRPWVDPSRVWWIDSEDEGLLELLTSDGQLAAPWGEGIVAVQPTATMEGLRAGGLVLDVIARRADAFQRVFSTSTTAQLLRDWGPRRDAIRKGQPVPLPPLREHLIALQLEHWVTTHRTRAIVEADHPEAGGQLGAVELSDTARLLDELGRRDSPRSAEELQADLLTDQARIDADLALFTALGTLPDWAPMRSTYERLARALPRWPGSAEGGA